MRRRLRGQWSMDQNRGGGGGGGGGGCGDGEGGQTTGRGRSSRARLQRIERQRREAREAAAQEAGGNSETTASEILLTSSSSSATTTPTITTTLTPECNIVTATGQTKTTTATTTTFPITSRAERDLELLPRSESQLAVKAPEQQQQQQQEECDQDLNSCTVGQVDSLPTESAELSGAAAATTDVVTPSVNAVRALFRDRELQVNQASQPGGSHAPQQQQASIVAANRRLIERQIEAIQATDSRRWNFDFRNCRPLGQRGHRYLHCTQSNPLRNRRPLNDKNTK